jgi:hypothetical protein
MNWWQPDQMEIARLEYVIIWSWNNETRKRAVDALASYRKNALPSLTRIASIVWDVELKH